MTIVVPLPGPAGLTFLELCRQVRVEVMARGTGPDTVLNQTGEYERIVQAVADADMEIQQKHDNWRFMVSPFALTTVPGEGVYPGTVFDSPISDLRKWKEHTIKCYRLAGGRGSEGFLSYIDPEQWDYVYNTGAMSSRQPQHYSVGDDMELLLGPAPDAVYMITGKYQRAARRLVLDTDKPAYPAEFHKMAVYLAMMTYGRQTGANEVYQDGQRMYIKMLSRMERTQLPKVSSFIPLA